MSSLSSSLLRDTNVRFCVGNIAKTIQTVINARVCDCMWVILISMKDDAEVCVGITETLSEGEYQNCCICIIEQTELDH